MKYTAILTFVAVACWAPAYAQPLPIPLTVEQAIGRAFETSHRLAEARAREEGALATVSVRRAAEGPTVNVNASYTRTNHVEEFGVPQPNGTLRLIYPDIPDNYLTRVSFQWPIYTAGRLDALERAASAEARAASAEIRVARADLRLEVVRAYWALATANDSVRALQEALARAEAHLRDVQSRFTAGLIPPNEVSTVEAQRSRQQVQLIEAQSMRASALEDLKRLTGLPATADVAISDRLLPSTPAASIAPAADRLPSAEVVTPQALPGPTDPSVTQAAETALEQRAERRALVERVAAAEDRQRAAAAGTRPTVALTGSADYANPNPRIFPRQKEWRDSWDVAVNVNWPIWDSRRARAETAEATAAATALRERLADLDLAIVTDVRQRQLDIASARAAISAAEDAIRSAEEARRVVAERFNVGVATSTEVLDAQVQLLLAELDRTRAVANFRLAEARLDRALGREP